MSRPRFFVVSSSSSSLRVLRFFVVSSSSSLRVFSVRENFFRSALLFKQFCRKPHRGFYTSLHGRRRLQRSRPCIHRRFSRPRDLRRATWHGHCQTDGVTLQTIDKRKAGSVAIATHCPYCALQCGMRITREDATVSGDESFPVNSGALCVKGWTA